MALFNIGKIQVLKFTINTSYFKHLAQRISYYQFRLIASRSEVPDWYFYTFILLRFLRTVNLFKQKHVKIIYVFSLDCRCFSKLEGHHFKSVKIDQNTAQLKQTLKKWDPKSRLEKAYHVIMQELLASMLP
ncbi:hypothetical protein V6Z12_D05G272600 [Gossypium hirsutum]